MKYKIWKKNMDNLVVNKEFDIERIPSVVKKCPKCNSLTLIFDVKRSRIYCTKCGFEEFFKAL